ncbi:hypothetical protein QJQ45_020285 [Haematococcus lacustris]|nr:hypothetical protein QJQ45_020285 [Haematococcus lacustris]
MKFDTATFPLKQQPANPTAKRLRAARPGQVLPSTRPCNPVNPHNHQADDEPEQQEMPDEQQAHQSAASAGGASRGRKHRVETLDAAWRDRALRDLQDFIANSQSSKSAYERRRQLYMEDMQKQVQEQQACCCPGADLTVVEWYSIEYVSVQFRFPLQVPQCRCQGCKQLVAVSPVPFGCWGNTPVQPSIWFDQSLLQSHSLLMAHGMSFGAPYPLAFSLDGVVKFNHFGSAGQASQAVQPRITTYVSPEGLDGEVIRRHEANQLNLHYSMAGAGTDHPHSCTANLSCSRPTAASGSTAKRCDITGVIGCVCCHGVPARGQFCNMRTPEQFTYYLLLIERVLLAAQPVQPHIYVDFACRLKKTWANYVTAQQLPSDFADVQMWVPWMHAASHDQTCQLGNNARYQAGAASRIGEQAEHMWSGLKDMTTLARYMTHAHRTDALQIRLATIAFDKQAKMVEALVDKRADMVKKEAELTKQLEKLRANAQAAGISDGEDAAAQYKAKHVQTEDKTADTHEWPAQYVLLKLTVQAIRYEACQPAMDDSALDALPHLSPGLIKLLASGKKVSQLPNLEDKVTNLGIAHDVDNLSGSWCSPELVGASVHEAGLAMLKDDKITGLRDMVWQDVLLVSHLETQHKLWGVADKDSRALARQGKAKLKHAQLLLDELAEWEVLGTPKHPDQVRIDSVQLRAMVQGAPAPWEEECQSTAQGTVLFYGRQFLHALSDSARYKEQLALLHIERGRLHVWLQHMLRMSRHASDVAAGGKRFYLEQHIVHFEVMLAKLQALQWS